MISSWHRAKAVSIEKRFFLVIFAVCSVQVLGEVFMYICTSLRGKSNRSHGKSEFQMFSLISGHHVVSLGRTLTWRLHSELCKFAWNALANNSRTMYGPDLSLEEGVYLLIFCNI